MTIDPRDLAAAYALDALEPDERRRFEAAYPDDHVARTEVAEFRDVASELAASAAEDPPATLKADVMARIATTEQLPPRRGELVDLDTARRRRTTAVPRTPLLLAAAAALLVIVGLSGVLISAVDDRNRAEEIAAAIADPDAVVVDLAATGEASGDIRVIWRPGSDTPLVVSNGLDDPGPDRVHQLWALGADGPVPAGLFPTDGTTDGRLDIDVDATGWAVTVEPAGGSPAPTSDILFITA